MSFITGPTVLALAAASTGDCPRMTAQHKISFRRLLGNYDARDTVGFAIVVVQAIAFLGGVERLADILGVPVGTVTRWSLRASTPPYLTRAAAVHVLADLVDNGPSRTDAEKRALVDRVQRQVAADLDHQSAFRTIPAGPHLIWANEVVQAPAGV